MMHIPILKQEPINLGVPPNYRPKLIVKRRINYGIHAESGRLKFWYESDDDSGSSTVEVRELNLDVYDHTEFHLSLSEEKDWWWSKDFDAVTTKLPLEQFYGDAHYIKDGEPKKWDRKGKKNWSCQKVTFLAAHNSGGTPGTKHAFSLNIDLLLPGGDVLPISLDPDIENPPRSPHPLIDPPQPGLLSASPTS